MNGKAVWRSSTAADGALYVMIHLGHSMRMLLAGTLVTLVIYLIEPL